jgi:hypothetical protein
MWVPAVDLLSKGDPLFSVVTQSTDSLCSTMSCSIPDHCSNNATAALVLCCCWSKAVKKILNSWHDVLNLHAMIQHEVYSFMMCTIQRALMVLASVQPYSSLLLN